MVQVPPTDLSKDMSFTRSAYAPCLVSDVSRLGDVRGGMKVLVQGDEDSDKRVSAPVRVGLRGCHKLIESPAPPATWVVRSVECQ